MHSVMIGPEPKDPKETWNVLDLGKQETLQFYLDEFRLEFTPDGKHIRWAHDNRRHPRNWTAWRKTYDFFNIICSNLFTTATSTAGSCAANHAYHEFNLDLTFCIFLFVSVYLLGQALGGVIFPAYSEAFGRKKLYVISTVFFSAFCVVTGAVPSIVGVVLGRFLAGFASAVSNVIIAGSIEELYNSKDRIWAIYVWSMISNMGLIVGPITSTWVTAYLGWRWVFYVAAIVTAVNACGLLFIRESRPSLLLAREVVKLRAATGIPTLQSLNPDHMPDLRTFARVGLFRPVRLFFTEPIVFMVSIMSAVAFAFIYLFTEALPPVYESFNFTETQASLPFIAIGTGLICGVLTRFLDVRIIATHARNGEPLLPEHKLTGFQIGAPVLACGLWWFAWTIPPLVHNVHWLVSMVALVFVGYSLNEFDAVLSGYLADSYLSYAASGFAALALLRSLLSAAFPLFARQMFSGLGANVAVSVLAALATVFCIVPVLFTRYGRKIRARSQFARYSLKVSAEGSVEDDKGLV